MEPLHLLGLSAVGVAAGIINTLAGGGSLLSLPALIFFGLPPHVANATNRVGVILQASVASTKFHRDGHLEFSTALRILPWTLIGSFAGAFVSLDLNEALFRKVVGAIMLLMLGVMIFRPGTWLETPEEPPEALTWKGKLSFLVAGLYGGFIQAGVGVLLLSSIVLCTGRELSRANAIKAILVAAFTVPPLLVFLWNDLVAWVPGLALASGSMLGGWLGARLTMLGGSNFVRWILIGVVLVSSVKLLTST